jgi:hypothetical protein
MVNGTSTLGLHAPPAAAATSAGIGCAPPPTCNGNFKLSIVRTSLQLTEVQPDDGEGQVGEQGLFTQRLGGQ